MRVLLQLFGWLNVGLGAVGVFVPLLPTTPFLLVAAWAFARSSERFHEWLVTHPRLGPPITNWREHRAISRRLKLVAVASLVASLAIALAANVPDWALLLQVIVLTVVGGFIVTRPGGE